MKNVLIICLALLTFSLQAQPGNNGGKQQRNGKNMNYTPEQIAELRTKKMVLQLDLTEKQEKKVYALVLEKARKRKEFKANNKGKKGEGKKGKDMSFDKKKEMLDDRIEEKKQLKSILTQEQFDKWETNMQRKNRKKSKNKKRN